MEDKDSALWKLDGFIVLVAICRRSHRHRSGFFPGALAANFELGKANGTYDAKYDEAALSNIRTGAAFQTLKQVPGSWRDW